MMVRVGSIIIRSAVVSIVLQGLPNLDGLLIPLLYLAET
jgi:hypothetical protein